MKKPWCNQEQHRKSLRFFFHDNRGDSLLTGLLLLILVSALGYMILTFSSINNSIHYIQETAQETLDTLITTEGRKAAESVKNGTSYVPQITEEIYTQRLSEAFRTSSNNITVNDENGKLRFNLSDIQLEYTANSDLRCSATMTLYYVMHFGNTQYQIVNSTIRVSGEFEDK